MQKNTIFNDTPVGLKCLFAQAAGFGDPSVMKKIRSYVTAFLFLLIAAVSLRADSAGMEALPFQPGEKLTFNLRWGIISAGTAVLEVHPMAEVDGVETYHFSLTVRTNRVLDRIYRVRDRIDAYVFTDLSGTAFYKKKQREGRHERDIEVTFDREAGTAQYSNFGKKEDPIEIVPGTFDPLSVFYAFRAMPFGDNNKVEIYVTDGKELQLGEGRLRGRETIQVPAGRFETRMVEPDMRDVGGVFEESDDATLRIWVSDDERRIPVRLSSKVVVGSFHAELIEINGEKPPERPPPPQLPRSRR